MSEKTTIRETKRTGIESHIISFVPFPKHLHQLAKERAYQGNPVGEIYSNAIERMRVDLDSGKDIILASVPKDGNKVQVWIRSDAKDDMEYLAEKLKDTFTTVAYNAMLRYFENEKRLVGIDKSFL